MGISNSPQRPVAKEYLEDSFGHAHAVNFLFRVFQPRTLLNWVA